MLWAAAALCAALLCAPLAAAQTTLTCDDLEPGCTPAGGRCDSSEECCLPDHTCTSARGPAVCTPPACDTTETAGLDGCACTVGGPADQCAGLRECTPEGPTAGTCQFFYALIGSWTADADFDLRYFNTDGTRFTLFAQPETPDPSAGYLAYRTDDVSSSCGGLSTETYTFTSEFGRNDVRALLSTGRVGAACDSSATLRAVLYGVEVASSSCAPCTAGVESVQLDTTVLAAECFPEDSDSKPGRGVGRDRPRPGQASPQAKDIRDDVDPEV